MSEPLIPGAQVFVDHVELQHGYFTWDDVDRLRSGWTGASQEEYAGFMISLTDRLAGILPRRAPFVLAEWEQKNGRRP